MKQTPLLEAQAKFQVPIFSNNLGMTFFMCGVASLSHSWSWP